MAYFFREDAYRHRAPDRPQGRRTKPVQLDPITVLPPKGRDALIEEQIGAMQDTIGKEDFLMKKLSNAPSHATGKRSNVPETARVNNIIPVNAKPDTPPALRLRPEPPAEVMQKLWVDDRKKDHEAAKMANDADPVEKMMQCAYPMPHPPSPLHARKRQATLPREPNQANEPAGLKGVGNYCEPPKPRGPRTRPVEYELPELILKPRTHGRKRGNIPEDQWSFAGGEGGSPRTAR